MTDGCLCGGPCPQSVVRLVHLRGRWLTSSSRCRCREGRSGPPLEGFPLSTSSLSSGSSTSSHPLAAYGWDEGWEAAFSSHADQGLLAGRVVRVDQGQCDVVTAGGTVRADTAFVTPHDPLRVVCTGDWVALEPGGTPRYVRAYLPRRSAFVRSTSSKRSEGQILAANVDHAIVAVSLAAELDLARVERFLALAWESGAQPLVVLTKADLVADPLTLSHLVEDVEGAAPGVRVLAVSSLGGDGLDVLGAAVTGGTSVLLGQSGAGKSTLANALIGEEVMRVHATRDVDGKGRTRPPPATCSPSRAAAFSSTPRDSAGSGCGTPRPGSARCSPRSRSWRGSAGSTTARTAPSPAVPCWRRSTTASWRSGGWRATASSSARTSGSSRRPTRGSGRSCAGTGSGRGHRGARR